MQGQGKSPGWLLFGRMASLFLRALRRNPVVHDKYDYSCEFDDVNCPWLLETPDPDEVPMSTIADLFNQATGDDAAVQADQAKLSADQTSAVAAHTGLTAAVVANGPTVVPDGNGGFTVLLPQEDGTVTVISAKDGTQASMSPPPGNPPAQ